MSIGVSDYLTKPIVAKEVNAALQRITEGFGDSLEGVWEGAVDLFVWIIVSLPYLVVWGVGLTVAVILVKRIRRRKPVKSFRRKTDTPAETEE